MSAPTLVPLIPTHQSSVVLSGFSRVYEAEDPTSYLDEIHIWSQRARVPAVRWEVRNAPPGMSGFYAVPIFPDLQGREFPNCVGRSFTRDQARHLATQLLLQWAGVDASLVHVRWMFNQFHSPSGLVHTAVPIVYEPPSLLEHEDVIGYGSNHKAAKEDSARKLLCLRYCWI